MLEKPEFNPNECPTCRENTLLKGFSRTYLDPDTEPEVELVRKDGLQEVIIRELLIQNFIMKTIVKREEITDEMCREILDVETHHNHEILKDVNGKLRWKENKDVLFYLKKISLNDLCQLLDSLGYGKNSEVHRKLYRDMGYSLFGYWEIFFWEANNEQASEYVPNAIQ